MEQNPDEKRNYVVDITLNRRIFVENVSNKAEAEERALIHLDNILISGCRPFVKIKSEINGEEHD